MSGAERPLRIAIASTYATIRHAHPSAGRGAGVQPGRDERRHCHKKPRSRRPAFFCWSFHGSVLGLAQTGGRSLLSRNTSRPPATERVSPGLLICLRRMCVHILVFIIPLPEQWRWDFLGITISRPRPAVPSHWGSPISFLPVPPDKRKEKRTQKKRKTSSGLSHGAPWL